MLYQHVCAQCIASNVHVGVSLAAITRVMCDVPLHCGACGSGDPFPTVRELSM